VQSERKGFVPCDREFLNFGGGKFSKSRGAAVDVPYCVSKYDPDPLHFYLTATAPETRDTEACPACPEQSRGEGLEGPALRSAKGHPGRIPSSATTMS
jgi:hypothetical protein